jgi:predicted transcriptional regulator
MKIDKSAVLARCARGDVYSDIARDFGCTRAYIHLVAKEAQMPARPVGFRADVARNSAILEAVKAGKQVSEIAADMGASEPHVYRIARPYLNKKDTSAIRSEIRRRRAAGEKQTAIAQSMGYSYSYVTKMCQGDQ